MCEQVSGNLETDCKSFNASAMPANISMVKGAK